jgi:hypothetical protein
MKGLPAGYPEEMNFMASAVGSDRLKKFCADIEVGGEQDACCSFFQEAAEQALGVAARCCTSLKVVEAWGVVYSFHLNGRCLSVDMPSIEQLSFPQFTLLQLFQCKIYSSNVDLMLEFCGKQTPKEIKFVVPLLGFNPTTDQVISCKILEFIEGNPLIQKIQFSRRVPKQGEISKKCRLNRRAFRRARQAVLFMILARRHGQFAIVAKDVILIIARLVWETRLDTYAWC